MRFVMAAWSVLMAGPASAQPVASPLVIHLECFDAWKGGSLREAGGGPGGAQWNTEAIVCATSLQSVTNPEVHSVRLRLQLGQGKALALAGERLLPAHPREVLALGDEHPKVDAIASVAANTPSFFIPAFLFTNASRQKSRQAETGAEVRRVRFLVTATGLDAKGRVLATVRDEIQAEFAFGE